MSEHDVEKQGRLHSALTRAGDFLIELPIWDHWSMRVLALVVGTALIALVVSTPTDLGGQLAFAALVFVLALILRKVAGQLSAILMIVLSITV